MEFQSWYHGSQIADAMEFNCSNIINEKKKNRVWTSDHIPTSVAGPAVHES